MIAGPGVAGTYPALTSLPGYWAEVKEKPGYRFLFQLKTMEASTFEATTRLPERPSVLKTFATKRVQAIDLLRGLVMIVMALDHTRDYFHNGAFVYSPEDLTQTNTVLFFTRWITHFCAPVFVFLAGLSAFLYEAKRGKNALAFFLFSRGLWLVLVELFILSLFRTFNPSFPFFNLQVIWAIGVSMMVLSVLVFLRRRLLLFIGLLFIAAHNLLDGVHVPGNGVLSFLWALLHETGYFTFGRSVVHVHYPLLPWIGIMATGYCLGYLYAAGYDPRKRRQTLLATGWIASGVFLLLRWGNGYGEAVRWSVQKDDVLTVVSFFNVSKYPPSLLYILMTLGPAVLLLTRMEKPLPPFAEKVAVFGRVPMFYYLLHILFIHLLAVIGAMLQGHPPSVMVLSTMVNRTAALKGYGFSLVVVYAVWIGLIFLLYPLCRWFDRYKRSRQATQWWLSYL